MYEERGDKERLLSQSINGPSSNSYSSMSSISPPQLSKLDTKSIWDSDDVKGSSDTLFTPTSASGSLEDDATVNVDVSSLGLDMDGEGNVYYLVDRITRTNDQPASLLLQQQLKSPSSPAHLQILFAAIMSQALPLMKNRFGNFLMQRLLETGTQEMKEGVATVMRGRIVELSCDRFGCHVVQKALETLAHPHPLIHELLLSASPRASHKAASLSGGSHNSISNSTLTHRFACHVWQRIFQLRYTPDPIPSIVTYLASELAGNWHKIANDENGSLVVQSIFEGCGGEKKDIVREILGRCGEVARGQWGNWVIQHLLEHGTPSDRQAILSVLASHFYTLSLDQYASKVLEKALKYCTKRDLFSVMELLLSPQQTGAQGQKCLILNMMGHQYANYVVQHLIMAGDQMQREMIVRVLLPHVGGLRNSKFGQRVAGLVEKIARGRGLVGAATNISTLGMNVNVGSLSNGNANLTSVNINALSIPTIPGLENYDYPPINVGLRC
ncbi:armadillo-type protein [Gaertneriomyces semiglobifer]|nr:armadillo-type protein [Gaertneriomyces semiglobifer]